MSSASPHSARPAVDPLVGHLLSLGLIAGLLLIVVAASGNLRTGPRIIDDNQIFELSQQASREGFRLTLADQIRSRAELGRLLPVFLTEKVFKARVYGSRVGLWKAHVLALGIASGAILYFVLCHAGFTTAESLVFALLVVVGPQSVLWVRLIHGEGLGLVLFAGSLACLLAAVRSDRWRLPFDLSFTALVIAAGLSKESFVLTVPALVVWRLVLFRELRGWGLREGLARSKLVISSMAALGLAYLIGSPFFRAQFQRWYVGYDRLEPARLASAIEELARATGAWWLLPTLGAYLALLVIGSRRRSEIRCRLIWLGGCTAAAVLLVAPQVFLYSKLGFASTRHVELSVSRYLVPAVWGVALIALALARAIRESVTSGGHALAARRLARAAPVALLALCVIQQALAAHSTTERFAQGTELQNDLMEFVRLNTDESDVILVVYDGSHRRFYRRLAVMLQRYVGRPSVMPFPVASSNPNRWERDQQIRRRTMLQLRQRERLPGAIVVESRPYVEEAFRREAGAWFRAECHRLFSYAGRQQAYVPARCDAPVPAREIRRERPAERRSGERG